LHGLIKPSKGAPSKAILGRASSLRGIIGLAIFARPSGTVYGLVRPSKTSSGLGTFADVTPSKLFEVIHHLLPSFLPINCMPLLPTNNLLASLIAKISFEAGHCQVNRDPLLSGQLLYFCSHSSPVTGSSVASSQVVSNIACLAGKPRGSPRSVCQRSSLSSLQCNHADS
jgi:hypothetical protein